MIKTNNGSEPQVLSASERDLGFHYAYEVASHVFFDAYAKMHGKEPAYERWKEWMSGWRAKKTIQECSKVMKCPVCVNAVVDPDYPTDADLQRIEDLGFRTLAKNMRLERNAKRRMISDSVPDDEQFGIAF